MQTERKPMSGSRIIPGMRYRDPHKMIGWLGEAFGFNLHASYDGPDGAPVHVQMTLGDGMIMFGPALDDDYGQLVKPAVLGQPVNQSAYVVVEDIDAHYAKAKESGAEILRELADTEYGSREYLARDPEGHLWSFGTFDPWVPQEH